MFNYFSLTLTVHASRKQRWRHTSVVAERGRPATRHQVLVGQLWRHGEPAEARQWRHNGEVVRQADHPSNQHQLQRLVCLLFYLFCCFICFIIIFLLNFVFLKPHANFLDVICLVYLASYHWECDSRKCN